MSQDPGVDGLTMRLEAKIHEKNRPEYFRGAKHPGFYDQCRGRKRLTIQEPRVSTKSITTNVVLFPARLDFGGLSVILSNSLQGVPYWTRSLLRKGFWVQSEIHKRRAGDYDYS